MTSQYTSNVVPFPDRFGKTEIKVIHSISDDVWGIAERPDMIWLLTQVAELLTSGDYLQSTVDNKRLCFAMIWTVDRRADGSAILSSRADPTTEPWIELPIDGSGFPIGTTHLHATVVGDRGWDVCVFDGDHWTDGSC
ncbi:MAG: hypothetical protein AAFX06_33360 [Planctomycetota bacterium]